MGGSAPQAAVPATPSISGSPPVAATPASPGPATPVSGSPAAPTAASGPDSTSAPGVAGASGTGATSSAPGNAGNPFSTAPVTSGPLSQQQGMQLGVQLGQQLRKDFGLTPAQAAGVVGNIWHESSGMNPNVNEFGSDPGQSDYGKPNGTSFGYGWAQWSDARKTGYLDWSKQQGLDPSSPAANYSFLRHELQTTESGAIDAVKQAGTASDAADQFEKVFERAASPELAKREAYAQQVYSAMG
jgi:hypothetical protein